jgi:hypothetical protein
MRKLLLPTALASYQGLLKNPQVFPRRLPFIRQNRVTSPSYCIA